ncbi:MAG: hypothetical protein PHP03_02810 [Candidatus Pacebacteria bacterium]|nr:hypothetical protein [Candidatus Paceibacterota bacterium]
MNKFTKIMIVAAIVAAPVMIMAQTNTSVPSQSSVTSVQDIFDIINNIVGYIKVLFYIAAGLFFIYAAYLYLTAAGNPEQVKKASNQLIFAVVAVVVALLSNTIVNIIQDVVK